MTRKDQIEKMAIDSGYTSTFDRARLCEGAEWADANPGGELLKAGKRIDELHSYLEKQDAQLAVAVEALREMIPHSEGSGIRAAQALAKIAELNGKKQE